MLGGRLATRQAALREVMAAGSRGSTLIPCLPQKSKALSVPREKYFWKREGIRYLLVHHKGKWRKRQAVVVKRAKALFYFE
jgi:hypothetical protein